LGKVAATMVSFPLRFLTLFRLQSSRRLRHSLLTSEMPFAYYIAIQENELFGFNLSFRALRLK